MAVKQMRKRITTKQRRARRKNIAVARAHKKRSKKAHFRPAATRVKAKRESKKINAILKRRSRLPFSSPLRNKHHPANVRLTIRYSSNINRWLYGGKGEFVAY